MGAVSKAHAPRTQVQLHDVEHLIGTHTQVLLEDQDSPDQSDGWAQVALLLRRESRSAL